MNCWDTVGTVFVTVCRLDSVGVGLGKSPARPQHHYFSRMPQLGTWRASAQLASIFRHRKSLSSVRATAGLSGTDSMSVVLLAFPPVSLPLTAQQAPSWGEVLGGRWRVLIAITN